jgi:hypothetical protein
MDEINLDDIFGGINWDNLTGDGPSPFIPGENFDWSQFDFNGLFPDLDDEGNVNPSPSGPNAPTDPGLRGTPSVTTGFGNNQNSMVQQLLRMLGLTTGAGGSVNGADLAKILPLIAAIYGGVSGRNATRDATRRMTDAASGANDAVRGILGGNQDALKPFIQGGADAMTRLSNQAPSNLSGQFGSGQFGPAKHGLLSTPPPISRGMLPTPPRISHGMLPEPPMLSGNFQPLGRGSSLSALGRR